MKKIIIIALSLALLSGILFYFFYYKDCCADGKCNMPAMPQKNAISLHGTYNGKNLFFQNPFIGKEQGFCITQIRINENKILEVSSGSFEIDLEGMGFKQGDKVDIEILHKEGCTPKILNPEVVNKDLASKSNKNSLLSVITCPKCGTSKQEIMPTDACLLAYTCGNCKAELRPMEGDCCVFCSYGSKKCPSMQ